MAFPLGTVLATAPGLISAATDLIRMIKQKKTTESVPDQAKLEELTNLLEQQARLIEDIALNNRNMAIVVRNNRVLSVLALLTSILTLGVVLFT